MKWVLIIVAVTANGSDLVIDKTEFESQETCLAAKTEVQNVNNTAIGSNARVESMCVQTGMF